jgi:hypothetical protein
VAEFVQHLVRQGQSLSGTEQVIEQTNAFFMLWVFGNLQSHQKISIDAHVHPAIGTGRQRLADPAVLIVDR